VGEMKEGELLAYENYDLDSTMNGFELNDPKMDI